ncbi:hypothetical protein [Burkholderia phage BCSR52]|uniref:Uncharacterized protein n=1 Tax=Burkholderia phage BCSR52 TaxID=2805748 RepID=A0A889IR56_9CAUD|nr:hypothetical protein [Burkholderia phage BCSR52]
MTKKARFPIGLEFTLKRGKVIKDCKIVDILTTTNSKGEVVKIEYDTTRMFCGQVIHELMCDTTIARCLPNDVLAFYC